MNAFDDDRGWPDDELQSLAVFDVKPGPAERTRQACLAVLERRPRPAARRVRLAWAEPLAVSAFGMLYLLAAIQASMALLRL